MRRDHLVVAGAFAGGALTFTPLINLQTAMTLGIEVPPLLLALADEVIE